ncbi:M23 family metallopeptidase [Chryseobacterium sp. MP_3.2]|uniref:M23 family metallopeptidase n=1 Tax=Chryseobacterium sp. MP_3.2 TaxID=3071712 RepID=UPI002E099EBA|nr:murein DD-endopeptidase MepM/ murein hydrolase activator NlpD [Chryseobacterium sp. MP_3.2]
MLKGVVFILLTFSTCLYSQDSINLKIYRETAEKTYILYVDNAEHAPISLEYSYTAENMGSSLPTKSVTVIPALAKRFLLTELKTLDPQKKTHFNYTVYYVLGDVNVDFKEKNISYTLPFSPQKKHSIYQGYGGRFSHEAAKALDFSLQIGEAVHAARAGKVVQNFTSNSKRCLTKECAKFNNKITILHDDGSLAEYVHLKQNGSVVKNGSQVHEGQLIGYSGNTGWSMGPHLHFSVYTPKIDGGRNYIKTKFKVSGQAKPIYLEEKKTYSRSL